jgi:hypothetical protein
MVDRTFIPHCASRRLHVTALDEGFYEALYLIAQVSAKLIQDCVNNTSYKVPWQTQLKRLSCWDEVRFHIGRVVDWLWWVETDVSELRPHGPIVHPRLLAMWTVVWWYRLGLTPNLSTRALWQPPVLSGGPVSRDISGASTKWTKEMRILSIRPRGTSRDLLHAVKSYDMGPPALLPIRRKVYCWFLSPLKSIALAGLEPATFGSSGKHTTPTRRLETRLGFA